MSGGCRHARRPATVAWQRRGYLRWQLLSHFDDDATFRGELADLLLPGPSVEMRIQRLASAYGLDRLIADGHSGSGPDVLRDWVRFAAGGGSEFGIAMAAGFGGAVGEVAGTSAIEWDPTSESLPKARERLYREIDSFIAAVKADAEAGGYLFGDTSPRLLEHIRWTYLRMRGWTYGAIADAVSDGAEAGDGVTDDGVRKAVKAVAKDLMVDVS